MFKPKSHELNKERDFMGANVKFYMIFTVYVFQIQKEFQSHNPGMFSFVFHAYLIIVIPSD